MANVLTISDLRKKKPSELGKLSAQLREQLRAKQFEAKTGQLKKMHEVKVLRRSVAKVETVIAQAARAAVTKKAS